MWRDWASRQSLPWYFKTIYYLTGVAILKKLAMSFVPVVEVYRIARE